MRKWPQILLLSLFFAGVFFIPNFSFAILALSDGVLVKEVGSSKVYFVENGMRRWIVDENAFNKLNFQWSKIEVVPNGELNGYPVGKIIDDKSKYPDGLLIRGDIAQGGDGAKIYLIKKGVARWIESAPDFENLGLDWNSVMDIPPAVLKVLLKSKGASISQGEWLAHPLAVLKDTPGKIIEESSAKFNFTGVAGRSDQRTLSFETFLEGVDSGWITTSAQERTVTLPKGSGHYTFFVRAKDVDGYSDRLPKSYSFDVKLSPYFEQVMIAGTGLNSKVPGAERLMLTGKSADPIDLNGWTVGSEKYRTSFTIPADVYEIPDQPYYEYKSSLKMYAKGKITIYSGASPLGVNFRLNKCIGYLNNYHKFDPVLPNSCPKPDPKETQNLTAYCNKIITSSIASCKEPNLNDVLIDAECRDYMKERFSYAKCVENNNSFYDFLTDEWRVYLNRPADIWANEKDVILLRDKDGLLVNRLKY